MSDYDCLESVLPGFAAARDIIKAADDSVFPLQYKGTKFDFYRFANLTSICDALAEFIFALIRDDFGRRLAVAQGASGATGSASSDPC